MIIGRKHNVIDDSIRRILAIVVLLTSCFFFNFAFRISLKLDKLMIWLILYDMMIWLKVILYLIIPAEPLDAKHNNNNCVCELLKCRSSHKSTLHM